MKSKKKKYHFIIKKLIKSKFLKNFKLTKNFLNI